MGALVKAVLVAVLGMALQGFIRHKNLLPHLEEHREDILIVLFILGLVSVAAALRLLAGRKLLFIYRPRHISKHSDHHKHEL
jgi:hypothetical protein